jgi:cytochrome c oxidase subunit IV
MSQHVSSPKFYLLIFAALMVLTVVTWGVALVDLGAANDFVALSIAVLKAVLVILFFMHVRYSTRLTAITVLGSFFWLAILILVTMSDYWTRGLAGIVGK